DGEGGGDGQEADAGPERRVALDELEVLRDQEGEAGEGEEGDGDGDAGGGEAQGAEQADGEHRAGDAPPDVDEKGEEGRAGGGGGEPHPQWGAWMMLRIKVPIPTLERKSPRQSMGGAAGSRDVGTVRATRAATTAAMGTMKRKTLPHQNPSRSQPPTIGPV